MSGREFNVKFGYLKKGLYIIDNQKIVIIK